MGTELLSMDRLIGFLLVLARVSGVFAFVPLPGMSSSPVAARIVFSLATAFCLLPVWPQVYGLDQSVGRLTGYIIIDAAVGMVLGLTVSFGIEALQLAAQVSGLQAGFGFVSTIDPTSSADSALLNVVAQLTGGLLFFAGGFDRQVLAILAGTLKTLPPGQPIHLQGGPELIGKLGGEMFSYALRMALPVIALLLLIDLTLAFLGRVNAQLQLLTLAFPVKILAGLAMFAVLLPVFGRVYSGFTQHCLEIAGRLLLRQ